MNQSTNHQSRLQIVVQEARDLVEIMKSQRAELQSCLVDLHPTLKLLKAEIVQTMQLVLKNEKKLKVELQLGTETLNTIEAHAHWKAAVLYLYGEVGVESCIRHMK